MKVDKEKCIACGMCVKDCIVRDIEIVDNKAEIKNEKCFKCGHCIAICPKDAVSSDVYDMNEVKPYNKEEFDISPDNLLNFIKFRRSTRHFKDKDVEKEKLEKILEAGRFTQTGSNSQNVSYVVVKDSLDKLKEITLETLNASGKHILDNLNESNIMYKPYAEMWVRMYDAYKMNPKNDSVFFNAPAVILVVSDSEVNAALASSNMELMTNALGLGTFFSGFLVKASENNKEIKNLVGLEENQKIVTCMVIGYPSVKYQRTVPRNEAKVTWK